MFIAHESHGVQSQLLAEAVSNSPIVTQGLAISLSTTYRCCLVSHFLFFSVVCTDMTMHNATTLVDQSVNQQLVALHGDIAVSTSYPPLCLGLCLRVRVFVVVVFPVSLIV